MTLGDPIGLEDRTGRKLEVGDVVLAGTGTRVASLFWGVICYGDPPLSINWRGRGMICIAEPGTKGSRRQLGWGYRAVFIPDSRVPFDTLQKVKKTRESLKTWKFKK